MIDYLIDTNIVIYLLKEDSKYINFINSIGDKKLGISVVTYMEVLVGTKSSQEFEEIKNWLNIFEIINLNPNISELIAKILLLKEKKSLKNPQFPDIAIACTAISIDSELISNNIKDFKIFKDLKILEIK